MPVARRPERYRRGDLLEKRIQLMKAWADYCAKPQTEASVTPIGSQRKTAKRPAWSIQRRALISSSSACRLATMSANAGTAPKIMFVIAR